MKVTKAGERYVKEPIKEPLQFYLHSFVCYGIPLLFLVDCGLWFCDIMSQKDWVQCSSENPFPTYVVGMFNNFSCYPIPGYVYFIEGSFRSGYFVMPQDSLLVPYHEQRSFLVGGDVSFRPHTKVPENLRFKVGSTKNNKPVYIGAFVNGKEEICGPVMDGICYAYSGYFVRSETKNYKCSPNNPIPSYVAGLFNNLTYYPIPGYVYYSQGSFRRGNFVVPNDPAFVPNLDNKYFLVGGDVSFRPHAQVPVHLRFKVGSTKENNTPVYIGTINIRTEEICGPVIDGLCYAYKEPHLFSDGVNYKRQPDFLLLWRYCSLNLNKDWVQCSPNNPIPTYVVGIFNNLNCYPVPGYAYFRNGSFRKGYFVMPNDPAFVPNLENKYFLVGGDVSFRPHEQVPVHLRFKVGSTKEKNTPVYIGTVSIGGEEICGPVIDGVCYAMKEITHFDSKNYKVLALNEE
ncbi:Hypothetical predicted protein [Cloeon dipterum]|uniref:Uncharacterized protein n=1 Tax=Cloeon dipterum TaxID=197152 RepID=A0A8S1DQD5_9INSE|nr:Hypothetical predicted protein [Cloeon dipterum]